jgi:hypothetical protein
MKPAELNAALANGQQALNNCRFIPRSVEGYRETRMRLVEALGEICFLLRNEEKLIEKESKGSQVFMNGAVVVKPVPPPNQLVDEGKGVVKGPINGEGDLQP